MLVLLWKGSGSCFENSPPAPPAASHDSGQGAHDDAAEGGSVVESTAPLSGMSCFCFLSRSASKQQSSSASSALLSSKQRDGSQSSLRNENSDHRSEDDRARETRFLIFLLSTVAALPKSCCGFPMRTIALRNDCCCSSRHTFMLLLVLPSMPFFFCKNFILISPSISLCACVTLSYKCFLLKLTHTLKHKEISENVKILRLATQRRPRLDISNAKSEEITNRVVIRAQQLAKN
mmetsp:Transcript_3334/g.5060  ORF Transcript_3334/g.5060 Transcript_3334/m.5060 type:complete len:234 (-) Transcript_3334:233-934(-)